jgi:hypothetical protein
LYPNARKQSEINGDETVAFRSQLEGAPIAIDKTIAELKRVMPTLG